MSNRIWSDEDIETLEKYYPVKTMTEMKEILPHFAPRQVNRRAKYMGLRKEDAVRIQSRIERSLASRTDLWSDEEKSIIIEYYSNEGAKGVKKRIKNETGNERPINNIITIANRMGITRDPDRTKTWKVVDNQLYEKDGSTILEVNIESGD